VLTERASGSEVLSSGADKGSIVQFFRQEREDVARRSSRMLRLDRRLAQRLALARRVEEQR
jgi:hypothetical protein